MRTFLDTPEKAADFTASWLAGESRAALARRFGYTHEASVSLAASRLGLPPRPRARRGFLSSPDRVAAFRADWARGASLRELTTLHGFGNQSTASWVAKQLDLPPRAVGRPRSDGGRRPNPHALTGGRWEPNARGVQVWVPDRAV